jgi:hypothetical protein
MRRKEVIALEGKDRNAEIRSDPLYVHPDQSALAGGRRRGLEGTD